MKKIAITGGGGFVAGSMLRQPPEGTELHAITRGKPLAELPQVVWHSVDPMDAAALDACLDAIAPDAVVHTAAIAAIDYCQAHQDEARAVNAEMAGRVAQAAARLGAKLVYCSTDNVFDGERGRYTEEDPPQPVNFYGGTKVEGERLSAAATPNHVIARVAIVMGLPMLGVGNSFLSRMIPVLESGEELGVPPQEIRSPIDVVTLGQALNELAGNDFTGIVHLSGNDIMNRWEMVRRIAVHLGFPAEQVVQNDPTTIPGRADRPTDVSLLNAKARSVLHTPFCGLEEGIARVMALAPKPEGAA
ncbi:MAG: sugar nucleotide-binding protein [Candidatus Hydrogenedens sp.]|nr:sugar nucleotide-binding protein [Candidatus Hydrogenedens sp.]